MPTAQTRSLLLLLVVATACGGDAAAPRPPAAVVAAGTPVASAVVATPLTTAPTFVVNDASGKAVAGVPVTVAVTAGGGTLANAPTTSGKGATGIGTWTLGQVAGPNTVTITVQGVATPLTITVTGTPGAPAKLVVASGNQQVAAPGAELPVPLVAAVQDQYGNGVAGRPVTFTMVEGGGSFASAGAVTTGADGTAPAPTFRLGRSAGPQTVVAQAGTFAATFNATARSDYNIEVRFVGASNPSLEALFVTAARRIAGVITGDIPDVTLDSTGLDLSPCASWLRGQRLTDRRVDDLVIYATIVPIDGRGGVVASAAPCYILTEESGRWLFPIMGIMQFDQDDLSANLRAETAQDVVTHEMLHVVGVAGFYWSQRGFVAGANTPDWRHTGPSAGPACRAAGGALTCATGVPIENTGGAGTAGSHWRETTFRSELMTGFAESAPPMPFSAITVGSLRDYGYVVNSAGADAYTLPNPALLLGFGQAVARPYAGLTETVLEPVMGISRTGRVAPLAGRPTQK